MSDSLLLQVQGILSVTPARWQHLAETLPEGLLTRQPLPGEWSARECLQHLLDTERFVFPVRVRAILAGQDFPAFDPEKEGSDYSKQTTLQLAEEFAKQRAGSLKLLEQVTAKDLACTGRHSELGQVTLEQLLNEWTAHDLMHTVQAERALMQPFIAGSGPWRFYFKDHDVGA